MTATVFRRGEPTFPASQPEGRRLDSSGINVRVSDAEFSGLEQQARDALRFLQENEGEIRRLAGYPGIDGMELDFAVNRSDILVESYRFEPELLEQVGRLGITLCVSCYVPSEEAPPNTGLDRSAHS